MRASLGDDDLGDAQRVVRLALAVAHGDHASVWVERGGRASLHASHGADHASVIAHVDVPIGHGAWLRVGACAPRVWTEREQDALRDLVALAAEAHVGMPSFSPAALYRAATGHLPNAAVLMFDLELRYVLAEGPRLLATAGLSRDELVGRRVGSAAPDPSAIESVCLRALAGETSSLHMRRGDRVFAVTTSPVRDPSGKITHGLLFAFDETERLDSEQVIRERSLRDPLTGLYHRAGFFDAMRRALAPDGARGVVVFADLDGLKEINDEHGHAAGDRAILAAAQALRSALREDDIVGRLGGDELAAFVAGATLDEATLAARIAEACAAQIPPIALSLGFAACAHGDDVLERLAAADRAMYADKRQRRSRTSFVP